jgi:hypothetical protein
MMGSWPAWCGAISVRAEFMVDVAKLKPSNACDAIGAVTEFMVDVARVEARSSVWRHHCSDIVHG